MAFASLLSPLSRVISTGGPSNVNVTQMEAITQKGATNLVANVTASLMLLDNSVNDALQTISDSQTARNATALTLPNAMKRLENVSVL